MMMARAKWRALSGRTAPSIAPSRRCRCQSSGRRIVRLSVMARAHTQSCAPAPVLAVRRVEPGACAAQRVAVARAAALAGEHVLAKQHGETVALLVHEPAQHRKEIPLLLAALAPELREALAGEPAGAEPGEDTGQNAHLHQRLLHLVAEVTGAET